MTHVPLVRYPIPRRQWMIAALIALALALLLVLPYWLGYLTAGPDTVYTGLLINVEDGTYLSAIEQGRLGNWAYRNLFTIEPHDAAFIQGFYLFLGHAARWLGLSSAGIWHLSLLVMNIIAFLTVFRFIAAFLPTAGQRWTAYLLALFASGFDWFVLPPTWERAGALETLPLDPKMPEAHIFYSGLTYPHFMAAVALIPATFLLVLLAFSHPAGSRKRWLLLLGAGICNLLLCVVYPYLILLIFLVLGLYFLLLLLQARRLLWAELAGLALVFLVPLPLLLYYAQVISRNPVMQLWNAQAVTLSPYPYHYLLAYLPLLIPALLSLPKLGQYPEQRRRGIQFLWLWVIAVTVLLYTPINPQRRFVEGLQIPLAVLASLGLSTVILPWMKQTRPVQAILRSPRYTVAGLRRLGLAIFILGASLTHLYLYTGSIATLTIFQEYPMFRPAQEVAAMDWLGQRAGSEDRVLATYWTGSYLPNRALTISYVGHLYETIDFERRRAEAEQFFQPSTGDEWRREFLAANGIDYVFVGPAELAHGPVDFSQELYMVEAFRNDLVIIYRISLPESAQPIYISHLS